MRFDVLTEVNGLRYRVDSQVTIDVSEKHTPSLAKNTEVYCQGISEFISR
jgi:hypothetical protein